MHSRKRLTPGKAAQAATRVKCGAVRVQRLPYSLSPPQRFLYAFLETQGLVGFPV